jgi:hypothetical protein
MEANVHKYTPILSLVIVAHLAGCSEQTHCDESTRELDSTDLVSELVGTSADQLLTDVGADHVIPVTFTTSEEVISQSPLGGDTDLTIRIIGEPREIREIDSRLVQGNTDIGLTCAPRLELDVQVEVSTEDGSFNEIWDGILSSGQADFAFDGVAILTAEFSPNELSGDFEILSHNQPSSPDSVHGWLSISFGATGSTGEIDILVEHSGSGSGGDSFYGQSVHRVLHW